MEIGCNCKLCKLCNLPVFTGLSNSLFCRRPEFDSYMPNGTRGTGLFDNLTACEQLRQARCQSSQQARLTGRGSASAATLNKLVFATIYLTLLYKTVYILVLLILRTSL